MIINIAIRYWWNSCIALGIDFRKYLIILMGTFFFFYFCSFAYLVQVYEIVIKSKWTTDEKRYYEVEINFFWLSFSPYLYMSGFFLFDNEIREFLVYDDRQLLLWILIDWKYQLDWRKKKTVWCVFLLI
jgi:hypothetical protein